MITKLSGLKFEIINVGSENARLLGATDSSGNKWIARSTIQELLDGVDFSKRFCASSLDLHGECTVRKGESMGLIKDGRVCVFVTTGLATTIIADPRYLKTKAALRQEALDAIEVFVGQKGPAEEKPKTAAEKIEEFVRTPLNPADISPAILKAVEDAGLISQEGVGSFSILVSDLSAIIGSRTILFMGQPITVYVTEKVVKESAIRKAYVRFDRVCEHLGVESDKASLVFGSIANNPKWGMSVVNVFSATGAEGRQKTMWLNIDSLYGWLSNYALVMHRMDPKWECDDRLKGLLEIYQSGLKEAALKFIEPLMKAVIPAAADNTAGVKTRCPVDSGHPGVPNAGDARNEPEAPEEEIKADADAKSRKTESPKFDRNAFLDAIKASKVPSTPKVDEMVLDPKAITMEAVAAIATKAYADKRREELEKAYTEIRSIESTAGISDPSKLANVQKPELPPKEEPKDPNWTWGDGSSFKQAEEKPEAPEEPKQNAIVVAEDQLMDLRFMGEHIDMIDLEGVRYVSVRHICENLGLSHSSQREKLQSNPKYTPELISVRVPHNDQRVDLFVLKAKQAMTWLAEINVLKVSEAIRPKLLAYQEDLMEAVYQYHTKGVAVNPAFDPNVLAKTFADSLALLTQQAMKTIEDSVKLIRSDCDQSLEYAADKTGAIVNKMSADLTKARTVADEAAKVAFEANKKKDEIEQSMGQVIDNYKPKAQAFDELVYSGSTKNISSIAHENGLISGTQLNKILLEKGLIIRHRRYSGTYEPSAKMMRMVPPGTELGCIEDVGKGKVGSTVAFGQTVNAKCWMWKPAGELLIKRVIKEYLTEEAKAYEEEPSMTHEEGHAVKLQSCPPSEPFPGKGVEIRVDGGKMPN